MTLLDEIRKKVETDQFEFSKHAVDQSIMNERETHLVEQRVTYTLEHKGQFYVVENVPARVDEETGEQFFSPSTVERLQETVLGKQKPERIIETPVYEYARVDRTSEE